ncbi:WD40-repeat-containing domain protein [Syncephalis plumigaleata]|nr:WD40-repeat-containing domain protein [Syncephalis plumigaleata]
MADSEETFIRAHQTVLQFLRVHGYEQTLEAFKKEMPQVIADIPDSALPLPSLEELLCAHKQTKSEATMASTTISLLEGEVSLQDESLMDPTELIPSNKKAAYNLGSNLIAVKQVAQPVAGIISSHVDRKLRFTPFTTETTTENAIDINSIFPLSMEAVVLCMDIHPIHSNWLLVSCMNGHVLLIDLTTGDIMSRWKNHTKYATSARFITATTSIDKNQRDWIISVGHDGLLNIYKRTTSSDDKEELEYQLHRQQQFRTAIEAVEVLAPKDEDDKDDDGTVIIALRSDPHFRYINVATGEERRFSINADTNDTHVSYTIMDMTISPCGRYLAVTTDKKPLSYVAVFACNEDRQVAGWYVAPADTLARSYVQWLGRRLLVTLGDRQVYVLQVGRQTPYTSWEAHTAAVRCFTSIKDNAAGHGVTLATGGFDNELRLWSEQDI